MLKPGLQDQGPTGLDDSRVRQSEKATRSSQLDKLAKGDDHDLMRGRFGDRPKRTQPTSTTRISSGGKSQAAEEIESEDILQEFLNKELKSFFTNQGDATLFVKVLCADGIAPWLTSCNRVCVGVCSRFLCFRFVSFNKS